MAIPKNGPKGSAAAKKRMAWVRSHKSPKPKSSGKKPKSSVKKPKSSVKRMKSPIKHTSRGWSKDGKLHSKEGWERGKGAPKKGNPRYRPVTIKDKNGNKRKIYKLRK